MSQVLQNCTFIGNQADKGGVLFIRLLHPQGACPARPQQLMLCFAVLLVGVEVVAVAKESRFQGMALLANAMVLYLSNGVFTKVGYSIWWYEVLVPVSFLVYQMHGSPRSFKFTAIFLFYAQTVALIDEYLGSQSPPDSTYYPRVGRHIWPICISPPKSELLL
eukprot:TRINITY_DN868_c0_g1_i10.p1 TRINITY_DN868_c0_g1~~TRINITY_DN868_c0_g1_i10.p1  ORF type:complete len:163 (-),score=16.69 TRINITY_DN868_c0_g1_i10:1023-1511(-)